MVRLCVEYQTGIPNVFDLTADQVRLFYNAVRESLKRAHKRAQQLEQQQSSRPRKRRK